MKDIAFAWMVLLCAAGCGAALDDQTAAPVSIAAEQATVSATDPNGAPSDPSAAPPPAAPPPMPAPSAESERARRELEAREALAREAEESEPRRAVRAAPNRGDDEGIICPGDDRCDEAPARVP